MREINGLTELATLVGQRLGESPWVQLDQKAIDLFADATGDHNFIHVDPERAARTPFGGTIAHGYHSLALIGGLMPETVALQGIRMGLNYGIEKARFPQAVPAGSRVRLRVDLLAVTPSTRDDSVDCTFHVEVEVEGLAKPSCVADIIFRYYPEV